MAVVVVGEALIDLIVRPDGAIDAVEGGGPFNAARTLARLGVATTFLGGLSDDVFGRRLAGSLEADGVTHPLPATDGRPTTLALAELDSGGAARYVFYVEGTSAPALTEADLDTLDLARTAVVHVGTLGLVLEPMAGTAEALVGRLPDETLLFVDPNCRPAIIADPARYRARLERILRRADVVKVSGDDLDYLDPHADHGDTARSLLALGARLVLFTDGADSVRILASGAEIVVPVPRVDVVDTVGAGDAFGGAFLATWVTQGRGRADLDDLAAVRAAVEYAVVVAGITCGRPGADPPRLAELPG